MAGSVNKAILIGHLGRDPEVRRTNAGNPVVNFSIATSESWKDKATGERKERTEWHNVVIFNEGLCKIAEQYLKKGSKVYLEGKIATREYTDKDGNQRKSTEIVLENFRGELTLLDRAERQAADPDSYGHTSTREPASGGATGGGYPARPSHGARGPAPIDDDIPF